MTTADGKEISKGMTVFTCTHNGAGSELGSGTVISIVGDDAFGYVYLDKDSGEHDDRWGRGSLFADINNARLKLIAELEKGAKRYDGVVERIHNRIAAVRAQLPQPTTPV